MPSTRITIKRVLSDSERVELIDAVHRSLVFALKIPEWDRLIVLDEREPSEFASPPGTSEFYTLVEISLFPGRTIEAKRNLYIRLVEEFEKFGISPNEVRVVLNEVPQENWGVRGGVPASEVELGFKVDV